MAYEWSFLPCERSELIGFLRYDLKKQTIRFHKLVPQIELVKQKIGPVRGKTEPNARAQAKS